MARPQTVVLARTKVRQALRRKGYTLIDSIQLSQSVDANLVDVAVDSCPPEVQEAVLKCESAVGGPILDAVLAFLDSDLGKTLIDVLLKLLLGL